LKRNQNLFKKKTLRKNPDIKSVQGIRNKTGGYHVIPGKDEIQTPDLTEEEIFTVAAKIRNKLERTTYLKKNLGPNLSWNDKDSWRSRWHKFLQNELNNE